VAATVLGYAALVAWRRPALPDAPAPPAASPRLELPRPERRPPVAGFTDPFGSVAAVPVREAPALAIAWPELPADFPTEHAGIAVFAAATGADLLWLPFQAFGGDRIWRGTPRAEGPLRITFAAAPELAVHGYLACVDPAEAPHRSEPPGTANPPVRLPLQLQQVRLTAPKDEPPLGPLRLQRLGDSEWLGAVVQPTGLWIEPGDAATLWLGAGRYAVGDPRGESVQEFAVPGPATVLLTAVRTPPRSRRS
jgi:hypothetical protein